MANKKAKRKAPSGVTRVEALEGVLRQLQKEAGKRMAITQEPERGRWEWVAQVTASGLK